MGHEGLSLPLKASSGHKLSYSNQKTVIWCLCLMFDVTHGIFNQR